MVRELASEQQNCLFFFNPRFQHGRLVKGSEPDRARHVIAYCKKRGEGKPTFIYLLWAGLGSLSALSQHLCVGTLWGCFPSERRSRILTLPYPQEWGNDSVGRQPTCSGTTVVKGKGCSQKERLQRRWSKPAARWKVSWDSRSARSTRT